MAEIQRPQNEFMMTIYEKLLNPLEPKKAAALRRIHAAIGDRPSVLVGAFARDLIFFHLHGINVPKSTLDIDISVGMSSWDDFRLAGDRLKNMGFRNAVAAHAEKFTDENEQEVDLLPFGGLSENGRTVVWPSDQSPWTITGIQEAFDHAWILRLEGSDFRVIPACALIYLKLFACHDRPVDRTGKDTADIYFVLSKYLDIGHSGRLRTGGRDADIMAKESGDLLRAAARLAGRDIGAILSPDSADEFNKILRKETESRSKRPVAHALAMYFSGQFGGACALLQSLRNGFEDVHQR